MSSHMILTSQSLTYDYCAVRIILFSQVTNTVPYILVIPVNKCKISILNSVED